MWENTSVLPDDNLFSIRIPPIVILQTKSERIVYSNEKHHGDSIFHLGLIISSQSYRSSLPTEMLCLLFTSLFDTDLTHLPLFLSKPVSAHWSPYCISISHTVLWQIYRSKSTFDPQLQFLSSLWGLSWTKEIWATIWLSFKLKICMNLYVFAW